MLSRSKKIAVLVLVALIMAGNLFSAAPQETEDQALSLEQARILEQVDRDYAEALKIYEAWVGHAASADPLQRERSLLGSARCLMKLGRYDEAGALLQNVVDGSQVFTPEGRDQAKKIFAAVTRLNAGTWPGQFDTVGHLTWQLLDAAAGTDDKRARTAAAELERMGELAVPVLMEVARSSDYFRAVAAIELLIRIQSPGVLEFLEACSKDPDPAIRKQFLDGLPSSYVPIYLFLPLLVDEVDSLGLNALQRFIHHCKGYGLSQLTPEQFEQLVTNLIDRFERGGGLEKNCVIDCLYRIVMYPADSSKGVPEKVWYLPHERINHLLVQVLEEGTDGDSYIFKQAVNMSLFLGKHYAQTELLKTVSRYWPALPETEIKKVSTKLFDANFALGQEGYAAMARRTLDAENFFYAFEFMRLSNWEMITTLDESVASQLLSRAARRTKRSGYLDQYLNEGWPLSPAAWAQFVEALLENENLDCRRAELKRLAGHHPGFDLQDPDCQRALDKWASQEDFETRQSVFNLAFSLLKAEKTLSATEVVLGIVHQALTKLGEPIRLVFKSPTSSSLVPKPDALHPYLDLLKECLVTEESRNRVAAWLVDEQPFGNLLEAVLVDRTLWNRLFDNNIQYALRVWPRLSPLGKDLLMDQIYDDLGSNLDVSRPEWLIPMFTGEPLANWCTPRSLLAVIRILLSIDHPALTHQAGEAIHLFLNNLENVNSKTHYYAIPLLKGLPLESEMVFELTPLCYERIRGDGSRSKLRLDWLVSDSPVVWGYYFDWLAGNYSPSFKEAVVHTVISRHGPFFRAAFEELAAFAVDDRLLKVASFLDQDQRDILLNNLVRRMATVKACPKYLESILKNPEESHENRYWSFKALLFSGTEAAIGSFLEYIRNLKPGQAVGPWGDDLTGEKFYKKTTNYCLSELGMKGLGLLEGIERFTPEARQVLCWSILDLSTETTIPQLIAVRFLSIRDAETQALVKDRLDQTSNEAIQWGLFYNLATSWAEIGVPQDGASQPTELSEEMRTLILRFMDQGPFDNIFNNMKNYTLESLYPEVRKLVLHHPDVVVRRNALHCLETSRNIEDAPILLECLKDNDSQVVNAAKEILKRLRAYEEEKQTWDEYFQRKTNADSPSKALVKMLDDEDLEVRLAALHSLGALKDTEVLPILVKIMAEGNDEEKTAAKAAVEAITRE